MPVFSVKHAVEDYSGLYFANVDCLCLSFLLLATSCCLRYVGVTNNSFYMIFFEFFFSTLYCYIFLMGPVALSGLFCFVNSYL